MEPMYDLMNGIVVTMSEINLFERRRSNTAACCGSSNEADECIILRAVTTELAGLESDLGLMPNLLNDRPSVSSSFPLPMYTTVTRVNQTQHDGAALKFL